MPYKSDAQRRWAHTAAGIKALGGKKKVAHWDDESEGMDLPERKHKPRAKAGDLARARSHKR